MRARLTTLSLLALAILAACGSKHGKRKYWTYCDDTGCYSCREQGCVRTGDTHDGSCKANADCQEGCFCDQTKGKCVEAGFCDEDKDCSNGYVCEKPRSSCTPQAPGGGTCKAATDCKPGEVCVNGQCKVGDTLPGTCKASSECKPGEACINGKCMATLQCSKDADCGEGMKCDSRNTCVPGPAQCAKDSDCAAGTYCASGQCKATSGCKVDTDCAAFPGTYCDVGRATCVPKPNPGAACKADADCKPGETCCDGKCKTVGRDPNLTCLWNHECGKTGRCVNGGCQAACAANADCGTGDVCTGGYCVKNPVSGGKCIYNGDCGANRYCINGTCHAACGNDANCAGNKADFCDQGICQPDWRKKPQCKANADCTVGQECVNAVCRTHCWSDSDCGACKDQPLCKMGYCTSQAELSPMCKAKVDCGAKNCINASCQ